MDRKKDWLRDTLMNVAALREILTFLYAEDRMEAEERNYLLDEAICRMNTARAVLKLVREEEA